MRIQPGRLIPLGYDTYVRSDEVVAVQPVVEGRGPGRRSLVWVRGLPEPLVASRSESAIADDLLTDAEAAARVGELRDTVRHLAGSLEQVPGMLRRVIREEADVDLDALVEDARRRLSPRS